MKSDLNPKARVLSPREGMLKKKQEFRRIYQMDKIERLDQGLPTTLLGLKNHFKVCGATIAKWVKEAKELGVSPPVIKRAPIDAKDPTSWWNEPERKMQLNKAIYESATGSRNVNAQKLAKQLAGELVEKKEVTFVLSADDYFRIRREAQERIRELTGETNRDRGLQPEPPLLLSENGVSPEQEHNPDSEVGRVGIPARPA